MNTPRTATLADEGARRLAVEGVSESLMVDAGAGTGKTTILVERLLYLVTHPDPEVRVPLSRVAAITFTEAAATELKERLRRRLKRAIQEDEGTSAEAAKEALAELDGAAIQTIHGFSRRILNLNPLAVGLPPGFRVLDEVQSKLRLATWWESTLEALFSDPSLVDAWTVWTDLGIPLSRLHLVALQMQARPDRSRDTYLRSINVDPPADVLQRVERVRTLVDLCPETDKFRALVEVWLRAWTAIPKNLTASEVHLAYENLPSCPQNLGAKSGTVPELKHEMKELNAQLLSWLAELRLHQVSPLISALRARVTEDFEARRREGALSFDDLLVLAREMMRDPKQAARAREQYRRILVDEFQDTDPLQLEIVRRLADDQIVRFTNGKPDHYPRKGEVFLVGDARQSIYRFRQADPTLFTAALTTMPRTVPLAVNFRSLPPVLEWVNAVLPTAGVPLVSGMGRDEVPLASRVVVVGASPLAKQDADCEMDHAAECIARILNEGWFVRDGDTVRRARADDIAVMFPTRARLNQLEYALTERHVPYRMESRSPLFEQDDVWDLLSVLRAIADPEDPVALVAALRSPAWGLDDEDLDAHVRAGGIWRADAPGGDSEGVVAQACVQLAKWQREVTDRTVSEWLAYLIAERSWWATSLGEQRPRDRWQRLRRLADHARRYEATCHGTLGGFLDACDDQADEESKEVERVAPESDDAAVRLMTVHAAKGLEFPIVVVVGVNRSVKSAKTPVLQFDEHGIAEIALTSLSDPKQTAVASSGARAFVQAERMADREERRRLLYVALTRARDHLVVLLHHAQPKEGKGDKPAPFALAAEVADRMTGQEEVWEPVDLRERTVLAQDKARASRAWPVDRWPTRAQFQDWRRRVLEEAPRVRAVAATTLSARAEARFLADEREADSATEGEEWSRLMEDADDFKLAEEMLGTGDEVEGLVRRGRKGAHLGRAVHTALQMIDPKRPMSWGAVVEAQCTAEGVGEMADEALAMIQRAASSPAVARAWGLPHWREAYLASTWGGTIVEGYLDLLARRPDGCYEVIDYKTDADVTPSGIEEAMRRYRVQGGTYAELVGSTLAQDVAEVTFVFIQAEPPIEVTVDGLEGWRAFVRRMVDEPNG